MRFIGSSNFSAAQVGEAERGLARERGLERFVTAQNEYSLARARGGDGADPGVRASSGSG